MKRLINLSTAVIALVGCQRNAVILPNSDPTLNKPAKSFADDAATRFPYPADLMRGGELPGRAEIGYDSNVITLVNFSGTPWVDAELWVNGRYVVALARVESTGGAAATRTTRFPFKVLYDGEGEHLPEKGVFVTKLELKLGGKLYDVPKQIGG